VGLAPALVGQTLAHSAYDRSRLLILQSCLRLVTALAPEQSEEWISADKRYLDMEELVTPIENSIKEDSVAFMT
jgi:hypothetical protein